MAAILNFENVNILSLVILYIFTYLPGHKIGMFWFPVDFLQENGGHFFQFLSRSVVILYVGTYPADLPYNEFVHVSILLYKKIAAIKKNELFVFFNYFSIFFISGKLGRGRSKLKVGASWAMINFPHKNGPTCLNYQLHKSNYPAFQNYGIIVILTY